MKCYAFVGPPELIEIVGTMHAGKKIRSERDVREWLRGKGHGLDREGVCEAVYVIGQDGIMRIAERFSPHVVCAGGESVLGAGEVAFRVNEQNIRIAEINNLSTGYCPEPSSWNAVQAALDAANIETDSVFSRVYLFRRCIACLRINTVDENRFQCAICGAPLPESWNLEPRKAL